MTTLPRFAVVRQEVPRAPLGDVAGAVRAELQRIGLAGRVRPGARVAVGAGSRGIADYALVVRAVVDELRAIGAQPFIFPAMGSHGGATAEGQRGVLAEWGITPETMGCPLVSSMDVVQVGETAEGVPVFCDAAAHSADGIIVVNRVKIHTDFHGPTESGLTKMLAIGLGKRAGAEPIHRHGTRGLREIIPQVAALQLARSPVLCGVAIVEDGAHNVSLVRALAAADIPREEPALLARSRALTARLPVRALDVLIVDRMGKDISGAGLDNNVLGRMYIDGEPEPEEPRIGTVVALRLTPGTHGNACGIGFVDIVPQALLDAVDHEVTRINVETSGFLRRGRIPPTAPTDRAAIEAAFARHAHTGAPVTALRIRDTLSLEEFEASESLLPALLDQPGVALVRPPRELVFQEDGSLV
ncbi:MAG TPA: DUF2088 domain-containing protein [Roseiflexaceae bacterium]|nr:DUF2088 domain-containing protein [Roseiflexaceae bacterium]